MQPAHKPTVYWLISLLSVVLVTLPLYWAFLNRVDTNLFQNYKMPYLFLFSLLLWLVLINFKKIITQYSYLTIAGIGVLLALLISLLSQIISSSYFIEDHSIRVSNSIRQVGIIGYIFSLFALGILNYAWLQGLIAFIFFKKAINYYYSK